MAKPKITRLGDPANPYTKKKVTAEEARRSAAAQPKAKPKPVERKKPSVLGTLKAAAADVRERAGSAAKKASRGYDERQTSRVDSQVDPKSKKRK